MQWTARRFAIVIALIAAPFLTPCSGPAQPTAADKAAIAKLAGHLRRTEGFDDHHSLGKWLVFASGAAATNRGYAHDPTLQIGGVKDRSNQDRILAEVRRWKDTSRFSTVRVYFYGDPEKPGEPSSALLNMLRFEEVPLGEAPP